jgi:hypothetical protein
MFGQSVISRASVLMSQRKQSLSITKATQMYTGLHVQCMLFLSDFNQNQIARKFINNPKYEIHKNLPRESHTVPCRQMNIKWLVVNIHYVTVPNNRAKK